MPKGVFTTDIGLFNDRSVGSTPNLSLKRKGGNRNETAEYQLYAWKSE